MTKIFDNILSKVFSSTELIAENEIKKAAMFRILAGLVILVRFSEVYYTLFSIDEIGQSLFPLIFLLIVIVFFIIGLITPIANLLIIIFIPIVDSQFNVSTLGSTIALILLVVNLLLNSGYFFSIDNWLISKNGIISRIIVSFYRLIGLPNEREIKKVYFLGFVLYAIGSLYAILLHVNDDFWIGGITIKSMLTNTFLCKHAVFFRDLEKSVPYLLDTISFLGIIFQSIFQIAMIPLVFHWFGKKFVIFWGFGFFFFSLFFLSLSYLPHIELILWIVIFRPLKSAKFTMKILYADQFDFSRTFLFYSKIFNINGVCEFMSASKSNDICEKYNIDNAIIGSQVVGLYNEKIYRGFDLYCVLVKESQILRVVYPFFWIGKKLGFGNLAYFRFSKKRDRNFNPLVGSSCNFCTKSDAWKRIGSHTTVVKCIFTFYLIIIVLFVFFKNSAVEDMLDHSKIPSVGKRFVKYSKRVGIEIPDVFNKTDLLMGDNFMVIKKKVGGQWLITPVIGLNGERMNYLDFDILLFSNHNSDAIYFSKTLKYRRKVKEEIGNIIDFHENGFGKNYIDFRTGLDYRRSNYSSSVEYKIEVYSSEASKALFFKENFDRFDTKKVFEKIILYKATNS
jgi:hypothetical protein